MKRFVLNGSGRTDGCFPAAFFQTQHASFSERWGGNVTLKNILVLPCAHEQKNNRTATSLRQPFQASAETMNLDFKIFDIERLINAVEERPPLYNKATPEYIDNTAKKNFG